MAEMATTTATMHFGARHTEGRVLAFTNGIFERLIKAWPASAALKLGLGRKQWQIATGTSESALALFLVEWAGVRPLGAFLAQDRILLGC